MITIMCAAIKRTDDIIIAGRNHEYCYKHSPIGSCDGAVMGFITSDGDFVDRKLAAALAFTAGQIDKSKDLLCSEDLTGDVPWAGEIIDKLKLELKAKAERIVKRGKLRLLVTDKCPRHCDGCCNKDWDLANLPVVESFAGYDEILLTGGEPMRDAFLLVCIIAEIRQQNPAAKIYLYTAEPSRELRKILHLIDGVTVTIHKQNDIYAFGLFYEHLPIMDKSLRLNIFKGVVVKGRYPEWVIKDNIEWIKDCPLPEGEVFMRYNNRLQKG